MELNLRAKLHSKTYFGEGCVPVGGQLGLYVVKPSFTSNKIVGLRVAPKKGIEMEGFLKFEKELK